MKFLVLLFSLLVSSEAIADLSYYPSNFQTQFRSGAVQGETLKQSIYTVLIKKHVRKGKMNDELVNDCGQAPAGKCYGQRSLGYRGARKVLFGKLHLEEDSRGYFIKDVYCRKEFDKRQTNVGPNIIPDHTKLNCEHTWPQSKFSKQFSKDMQKSDLNHLYPTDSRANSTRGNYEFSEGGSTLENGCNASRSTGSSFEPPEEHKGNVARALFYFSVRYKMAISSAQERYLREWHRRDPVDASERNRNEWIQKIQGNRNPFIDYPHMVDNISDF